MLSKSVSLTFPGTILELRANIKDLVLARKSQMTLGQKPIVVYQNMPNFQANGTSYEVYMDEGLVTQEHDMQQPHSYPRR